MSPTRTPQRRLLVVASPMTEASVLGVFEAMLERGAELVFAEGDRPGRLPDDFLARPGVTRVHVPLERKGPEADSLRLFRHAANTLRHMNPEHPTGRHARIRSSVGIFKRMKDLPESALDVTLPKRTFRRLTRTMSDLERLLPPHPELEEAIAALAPDAVLLLSRLGRNAVELDVLKVAHRLGLPTVMMMHSWDNLSSKGVLHEHPDDMLVWNDTMAWEAAAYHAMPPERVHVVGAAVFDRFFELAAAEEPAEPAEPSKRRLLYVGSAPQVVEDEVPIFADWLAAARASTDPALREAQVDVRPHPANKSWRGWTPDDPRVTLHAARKLEPDRLLAMLRSASAVIGLNTSAQLEAAIAGRPTLTFRAGPRAAGQEDSNHFWHLLEERDGFVVDARDLDEHVVALSRVLHGEFDQARIERFVGRFLRPMA